MNPSKAPSRFAQLASACRWRKALVMERPVLDHGFVSFVESWGSDEGIVEAARMSTARGFLGWGTPDEPGDEKLLRHLKEHRHESPFEQAGMTIRVQAPIFVFREWHRHRTQSYNEHSARYAPLPPLNYLPDIGRVCKQSKSNKQSSAEPLDPAAAQAWLDALDYFYESAESLYQHGLQLGVARELARLCIPVGRYSRMQASANLRNWLAFLTLRDAVGAQWEIRQYAIVVRELLVEKFPRTMELFDEEVATSQAFAEFRRLLKNAKLSPAIVRDVLSCMDLAPVLP